MPIPNRSSIVTDRPDLLVIGGGINGVSIARDAALRGLSVVLVERDDIGSGTSSTSTKLIHGGLRYLQHREWTLVRDALTERGRLLGLASFLVHPLKFVLPVYRHGPHRRWFLNAGLTLYDLLARGIKLPNHRSYSSTELLDVEPALGQEGLEGGLTYHDAQVPYPERFCLANAIDAADAGTAICNHTEVVDLIVENGSLNTIHLRHRLTGQEHWVRPRMTINAAGPWVDRVAGLLSNAPSRLIGATRGTHILLPRKPDGPECAIYSPARSDGRPFFVVPWRDYYWVGTTDIPQDDPDNTLPTDEEIDYLIRETIHLLPQRDFRHDDIIYAAAGLRPLPFEPGVSPAKVTRRHLLHDHRSSDRIAGLISVVGGKLTTGRQLAQEAVDEVARRLNADLESSTTSTRFLPGAGTEGPKRIGGCGLDADQVENLTQLHGDRADELVDLIEETPELRNRLDPQTPDIAAQVIHSVQSEWAVTIEDVLLRRTGVGTGHTQGIKAARSVGELMAVELGWTESQEQNAVDSYLDTIKRIRR
ncbi:MAG: glycerol-3-phosphate dehydrogenase/oxidase [Candidatus Latescibacteria bacterium]|jgi:glycerol-3-phosphate dehydrogenase|nr:glycerol-3-phosphate dehydrogenase/oxidase [Candidatus Latescibacterota bacterium]